MKYICSRCNKKTPILYSEKGYRKGVCDDCENEIYEKETNKTKKIHSQEIHNGKVSSRSIKKRKTSKAR